MPIFEALPRGVYVNIKQKKVWLDFKYERIPSICKWCGYLDHHSSICNHLGSGVAPEDEPGYGEWMLFQPPKKGRVVLSSSTRTRTGRKEKEGARGTSNETAGGIDLNQNLEDVMNEDQSAVEPEGNMQNQQASVPSDHNRSMGIPDRTGVSNPAVEGEDAREETADNVTTRDIPPPEENSGMQTQRPASPKRKSAPDMSPSSIQIQENAKRNKQLEMERRYLGAIRAGKEGEGKGEQSNKKVVSTSKTLNARLAEAAKQPRQAQ